jgi:hypothetical protein
LRGKFENKLDFRGQFWHPGLNILCSSCWPQSVIIHKLWNDLEKTLESEGRTVTACMYAAWMFWMTMAFMSSACAHTVAQIAATSCPSRSLDLRRFSVSHTEL